MIEKISNFLKKAHENLLNPGAMHSKTFCRTYKFLQESQWWSKKELEKYQFEELCRLLSHAYKNVPYYRRIFDERGLKPKDVHCIKDLQNLPYLTKDDFKKHFKELVATNVDLKNLPMNKTSGTSGKALQFYMSASAREMELAFIFHQWARVGYEVSSRRVSIRGSITPGNSPAKLIGPRSMRLSPCIGTAEIAKYYLMKIKDFKADFLHGYPSAIASFAHIIKRHGFAVPFKLKSVLFASEVVYDWQRKITSDVFGCKVFSHYGMGEQAVLAAECENSSYYHCMPQYGIAEVVPGTNEIIGTGFLNYVNPFIRYRTTDIVSDFMPHCNCCGRNYYPIFGKVEGRVGDCIMTSRGLIGPGVITHPFTNSNTIRDTQIIQKATDLIILRIVPWDKKNYAECKKEAGNLCRELRDILGNEIRFEIQMEDKIERLPSGKFKWIKSDISQDILKQDF